jgi:micrococcal nuclease
MRASSVLLLALVLSLLSAAAAGAATGPCFPGDRGAPCHFQTATVTSVNDGDTVEVDLDGDRSRRIYSIRFRGVQAMELRRYSSRRSQRRGQCHAVAAANRVEDLVRASRNRVRLSSQSPSTDSMGRLIRWVAVRRNGRWQDLGAVLMREGRTLWMDNTADTAWNHRYNVAGQQAAQAHRNLWNTATCGAGPQQQLPIRVWVLSDPPGWDTPDGEWVKVQNRSATETLRLGGWWIRDAMLRRFTFPAGTTVAPGATATLHVGTGTRRGNEFFWGQRVTVFENPGDSRNLGDGAYLFDPRGDLRAWMVYPCRVACSDRYQGTIDVLAQPHGSERVTIRNRSDRPVDLYGYALAFHGSSFAFDEGTVLAPGETMTISLGDLGVRGPTLPDGGGAVRVSTFNGIALGCDAWGSGTC